MKVLIAEDNKESRYLLEMMLKGYGHEVTATANGAEALEQALAQPPDMIVSDILMPVMDGFQLCQECKQNEQLKNIPFIFYTATYTSDKDERFALSLGANAFILKPTEPDILIQKLSEEFEKAKSQPLAPDKVVPLEPSLYLSEYNQRIVAKLEQKVAELETEITERKRAEEELKHLNLVLRAIRNVNQLIIREKELPRLLQGICDNLIVNRGYHTAWIAVFDESGRLKNSAEAGLGKDFLPLVERLKSGDLIYCQRETLSKSGAVVIGDSLSTCADCPLAETHRGKSAMCVRLEHREKGYGLLSVCIPAELTNEKEEQSIFEEVAGDISFALYGLEMEEERKRAEEALRESEEKFRGLFDGSTDAIFIANPETRKLVDCNEQAQKLTGYSRKKILSMKADQLHPKDKVQKTMEDFKKHAAGELVLVESEILTKEKKRVPVSINSSLVEIAGEKYLQGIFRDVTERQQAEKALRESEEKYRMIAENMSDVIFTNDMNRNLTYISPSVMRSRGYTPEEAMNLGVEKVLTPASLELAAKALTEHLALEEKEPSGHWIPLVLELEFICKDGSTMLAEVNYSFIRDKDNRPVGILGVSRDITERKRAEKALKESELRFRTLFENAPLGIFVATLEGRMLAYNDTVTQITGYSAAELEQINLRDLYLDPEERSLLLKRFETQGSIRNYEVTWKRKDDTSCPATLTMVPSIFDGQDVLLEGIIDITERKQAEKALLESEEKYRMIAENMSDVIFTLDLNGNFTYISPSVMQARGYTPEEAMNLRREEAMTPASLELIIKGLTEELALEDEEPLGHRKPLVLEFEFIHKNGSTILMEVNYSFIRDKDNRPVGILGVSRDITERKQAEKALLESEEKYRMIAENMSDVIFTLDLNGNFTYISPSVMQARGYTPEEAMNLRREEAMTPASLELIIKGLTEELALEDEEPLGHRKPLVLEFEFIHKNGSTILMEVNYSFIRDKDNRPVGILGVSRDITERKQAEKALLESEEKYRMIAENMSDVIFTLDLNGNFTYISPSVMQARGYTPEEAMNLRREEAMTPASLELIIKGLTEELALEDEEPLGHRKPLVLEFEFIHKNGSTILMEVNYSFIRDKDNRPVGILGVSRDITERKQAEKALRESEERYRTLYDSSRDAIMLLTLEKGFFSGNPATIKMFGCQNEDEFISLTTAALSPEYQPDGALSVEKAQEMMSIAMEYGSHFFEWKHKRVYGGEFFSTVLLTRMELQGEKILQSTVRDITDRKQAEQEIQEYSQNLERMVEERTKELNRALYDTEAARDRIDGILKSVADGLIVTDLYNRVVLMNRATEDLLGVRLSEAMDRPIDFAIEDKTLRDRIKTTLDKKKEGYEFDFELPGEDTKHPRIMRARTSVIENKTGKHTGIITIIHDVTYEREVDRMKTEFLSTAAHELRTPLTSIQGFSEILLTRNDIKEEEKEELLSYINKQSVNLAAIINDLLDISRIESGKGFTLYKVPCNIADIIKDTIPYFETLSPRHSFEVVVPEEPVEVMVDKEKMGQVLENLLSNAVKYSPEGGLIRITGELLEENYQVSVKDQGMGMTSEQVEKIFDKFYRADASNTAITGTGLGMNIVKYIVEAHGGTVWVESELGKGHGEVYDTNNMIADFKCKMRNGDY